MIKKLFFVLIVVALFSFAPKAFAAISLVQVASSTVGNTSATGVTTTIASVGAGNTLIVLCGMYNNQTFDSASDGTNTYIRDAHTASTANNVAIFRATNVSAGTYSIRCNGSGASSGGWNEFVHEYSGLDNTTPVNTSSSATGNSANPAPGAITTTENDTVVVATGAYNIVPSAINLSAGYVLRGNGMGNYQPGLSYDKIFSSTATTNATSTMDSSGSWAVASVAYTAAAGAPAAEIDRSVIIIIAQWFKRAALALLEFVPLAFAK